MLRVEQVSYTEPEYAVGTWTQPDPSHHLLSLKVSMGLLTGRACSVCPELLLGAWNAGVLRTGLMGLLLFCCNEETS